jgi:hypothetical protein
MNYDEKNPLEFKELDRKTIRPHMDAKSQKYAQLKKDNEYIPGQA